MSELGLLPLGMAALLLGVLFVAAELFQRYDPSHPEYQEPSEEQSIEELVEEEDKSNKSRFSVTEDGSGRIVDGEESE